MSIMLSIQTVVNDARRTKHGPGDQQRPKTKLNLAKIKQPGEAAPKASRQTNSRTKTTNAVGF